MSSSETILTELNQAAKVLEAFSSDREELVNIDKAADLMVSSILNHGKIISCGNGGSHCDSMHFAEELLGKFRDERRPLPAVSISDPSYISCTANDYGFDQVFSRFIEAFGSNTDTLLAISTSGNSENILRAIEAAKHLSMKVVVLTGPDGGRIGGLADVEIKVPHSGYADRIQEIHIKVIHILILLIEQRIS